MIPGPGTYNISQSNLKEKVVVTSKNDELKIIQVPKPLSVFNSATKRFNNKIQEVPGPGTYTKELIREDGYIEQSDKELRIHKKKYNRSTDPIKSISIDTVNSNKNPCFRLYRNRE